MFQAEACTAVASTHQMSALQGMIEAEGAQGEGARIWARLRKQHLHIYTQLCLHLVC